MKTFALAATVVAGLLLTTGSADAQFRYRSGYSYSAPVYSYPAYSYSAPSYYAPTYSSGVVTSGYAPYTSSVVPASGYSSYYAPAYTYPAPSVFTPYPSYSGVYNSGVYTAPSVGMYRGRGFRRSFVARTGPSLLTGERARQSQGMV